MPHLILFLHYLKQWYFISNLVFLCRFVFQKWNQNLRDGHNLSLVNSLLSRTKFIESCPSVLPALLRIISFLHSLMNYKLLMVSYSGLVMLSVVLHRIQVFYPYSFLYIRSYIDVRYNYLECGILDVIKRNLRFHSFS